MYDVVYGFYMINGNELPYASTLYETGTTKLRKKILYLPSL